MSRLNGGGPPDPLDELNDVIAELEGSEWEDEEITAEHILEAVKVGAAAASGKHAAMSKDQAEEITLTDHGAPPKQQSDPPKSGVPGIIAALGGVAVRLIGAASKPLGLGALVVLAALVAYWLRLRYGH